MTIKNKQLSASLEDYLEAIYNLSRQAKVARSKDIADNLSVSRASVTGALKLLQNKDLINYQPYGYITLTDKGLRQAQAVVRKHAIIESFFVNVLGVEKQIAEQAACKAEHALGAEVVAKLLKFTEFSENYGKKGANLTSEFHKFCHFKGV